MGSSLGKKYVYICIFVSYIYIYIAIIVGLQVAWTSKCPNISGTKILHEGARRNIVELLGGIRNPMSVLNMFLNIGGRSHVDHLVTMPDQFKSKVLPLSVLLRDARVVQDIIHVVQEVGCQAARYPPTHASLPSHSPSLFVSIFCSGILGGAG